MRSLPRRFSFLVTLCLLICPASIAYGNSEAEQHYMRGIERFAEAIRKTEAGPPDLLKDMRYVDVKKARYIAEKLWRSDIKELKKQGFKELTEALNAGFKIDPNFKALTDLSDELRISSSLARTEASTIVKEYDEFFEKWNAWRQFARFDIKANLNISSIDAAGHSPAPGVGIGGALRVRLTDRVALLTEGLFTLRTSGVEADLVGQNEGSPYYEMTYIDIVPLFEYTLGGNVFQDYRLYALGGIEARNMLSATLKNDLNSSGNSSAGISVEEPDVSGDTDKLSFASSLGVGFVRQTRHAFVMGELRYSKGFETRINASNVSLNSWYLTLGVGF